MSINREELRVLVEEELLLAKVDADTAAEIADTVAERCWEEGLFDADDDFDNDF